MWRAMAGEYQFARRLLREARVQPEDADEAEGIAVLDRALASFRTNVAFPRLLNESARTNAYVARSFAVPLDQYLAVREAIEAPEGDRFEVRQIADYAIRSGNVEAMRRVSLLTAELRSRAVPASAVARELPLSRWRNPYDGRPFEWSAANQAIEFESLGKPRYGIALYY